MTSLNRRAAFGHCAGCGNVLDDFAALLCEECEQKPENQTLEAFARANGHRAQIMELVNKGRL